MRKNSVLPVLIIVLSVNFLTLGLLMLTDKYCLCPSVPRTEEAVGVEQDVAKKATVTGDLGQENRTFLHGDLVEEEIPEDLEMGESWYWLYFDEPYLLVVNARGFPIYVDKIQVLPPRNEDVYNVEDFVGKRVEIFGYQTWGLSESSVFQVMAIREY